jgi:hypothetical protein
MIIDKLHLIRHVEHPNFPLDGKRLGDACLQEQLAASLLQIAQVDKLVREPTTTEFLV